MSWWSEAVHGASSVVHGVEDDVSAAVKWTKNFFGSHPGQVAPIAQTVKMMQAGKTDSWFQTAEATDKIFQKHTELAGRILALSSSMESAWTGKAASAAGQRISSLGKVLDTAARSFGTNGGHVADTAQTFGNTVQRFTPMPDKPPDTDFFDRSVPWTTDTEKAVNEYNASAKQNQNIYNGYTRTTQATSQSLRTDYGQLGTFDDDVTVTKPVEPPPGKHTLKPSRVDPPKPGTRKPTEVSPPPQPHAVTPPPGTSSHSQPVEPGHQQIPVAQDHHDDSTSTAGYTSNPVSGSGGGWPGTSGFVPPPLAGPGTGPGPGTGISVPYAGFGSVSEQPSPGAGAGTRGPAAPGNGAGSLTGGRAGGAEEGAARGGAGRAGAAGRPGGNATGMAPGAREKKEEDEEHQRKYVLDDDELFSDEDRDTLRDPETGMRPTPPVIGG